MKKFLALSILVFFIVLLFASSGWCLTIGAGTNVGGLDDFFAGTKTLANSSESTEEAWIQTVTGDSTLEYTQYDSVPVSLSQTNEDASAYAFELNGEPDYFLVKWGDGGDPDGSGPLQYVAWTLWSNNNLKSFAVFDTADPGLLLDGNWVIKNIGAFSHYGETGAAPVPEPSTILLMGLGLVGLAGIGRKKIKG